MSVTLNFDASQVAPATGAEPIPTDWYNAKIVGSQMKPTKNKDGNYLELELEVIDGEYAGRKVWDRLNLDNPNPVAMEIAYRQLSAICHSVGVLQVATSDQLHGRPLKVRVVLREAGKGSDGKNYDASNEVKGYKNINEGMAPAAAAPAFAAAPSPAPATAAAPTPPWARPAAPAAAPAAPPAPAAPAASAAPTPPWAR